MAAIQRKLVHKQFNSPMGLYSAQNVQDTLNRELKAFGTDGIEVDESLIKPSNLANSAVLKALEEEENEQYGGYKRVAWPPVSESRTIREFTPQPSPQPPYQQQSQQQQQQPQQQRPGASPVQAANQGGHYIQSQPNYQSSYPNQQQQQPSSQQHNIPEPYYLQQRSSQPPAAAGKPSSTVSFAGGVAEPVNNTPPRPQPQPQYHYPIQSPPQQQQQLYQPPPSPEPQPQQQQYQQPYQQQQQQQQYQPPSDYPQQGGNQQLDEPPRCRWGHVASPVPTRTGYIQSYQQPQANQGSQPAFAPEPSYGGPQPQQQNLYGTPSVPQVNQIQNYDRQPSYYGHPQQQPVAPAPIAPAAAGAAAVPAAAPQQYYQSHQRPQPQQYTQQSEPIDNQYNYYSQPEAQQQYQQQQQQPQQQQQQQLQQQQYRGESPGIITLRKEAPITQKPAPVYTSQPAAASFGGGANMRGDLKWPPPEYKEQAAAENDERRRIAQGPVCRPRRINKDYTQFFAKNALSHHYPSYKVPPGTQHIYGTY